MEEWLHTKGRIFDIQRYSIHDGNGIRTIVFLKGCVLRCLWCCNPESQKFETETMMVDGKPKVMGRDVTVEDVMEVVEKDRNYYRKSGGGMTLSGGESLCQPEFAAALLRAAKERGIGTAMESMGCAPYETIAQILPWLDTYLMDIKHMDPEKHRKFTGKRNELMLANARKIAESGMTEIAQIAQFSDKLCGVRKIHLLPYHRLGQDKYERLSREYMLKEILPPEPEYMHMLKKTAESVSRLECQIGG